MPHSHAAFEVLLVLGLLAAVTVLAVAAKKIQVPYPSVMVVGGLAIALIPGLPHVQLDPELVFVLFLPPLLYSTAWTTNWRDFKAHRRPIFSMAFGFVVFTTFVVAWIARKLIPDLSWPMAIVLGAVISPPDPIAATAVAHRLGIPRRIIVILEGEGLMNDATGLTIFRIAVAAAVGGAFSWWGAAGTFVIAVIVGIAGGLLVGWAAVGVHKLMEQPVPETVITLITPFLAYLLTEWAHGSGVLAVVVAGLVVSRFSAQIFSPHLRVRADAVWEAVIFLLNGLAFILIGLQLPLVLETLSGRRALPWLIEMGLLLSLVIIVVRFLWVMPVAYLSRMIPALARHDPFPSWRHPFFIAYTAMRGVDSLAAALAVPLVMSNGAPLMGRSLVLFLTFSVIVFTVVVQTLTLPSLIRWLGLEPDNVERCEENEARLRSVDAALGKIDELQKSPDVPTTTLAALRSVYEERKRFIQTAIAAATDGCAEPSSEGLELRRQLLAVERQTVIDLRNRDIISDEVLSRIEHDLDLEDLRVAEDDDAD